jgi:hypothetical protein
MKKLILSVFFGLALISCKKESNNPNNLIALQGTYHSSTTMELSAPIMYTQSGVITDVAFINKYLIRKQAPVAFNFEPNTQTVAADLLKMDIDGNLNVTAKLYVKNGLGDGGAIKAINGKVVSQSATDMLIQANKPDNNVWAYSASTGASIGKTLPIKSRIGEGDFVSLPQLLLLIKENDIYLSEVAYFSSYKNKYGYGWVSTSIYDIINPNLTRELFSGDTIVVQQRLVKLIK